MGLATSHSLKSLHVTESKLRHQIKEAKNQISNAEGTMKACKEHLEKVQEEISFIESDKELTVSEHAILRYIERHTDIDLHKIVDEIKSLDSNFIVRRGNTIVTILDEEGNDDRINL